LELGIDGAGWYDVVSFVVLVDEVDGLGSWGPEALGSALRGFGYFVDRDDEVLFVSFGGCSCILLYHASGRHNF
jgi:hypothetical protein